MDVVRYLILIYFNTILCLLLVAHFTDGAQFVSPNGTLLKLLVRNTGEVVVSMHKHNIIYVKCWTVPATEC